MPEEIGFVGLGLMGQPMARHLAGAGHHVRVYNRTRSRAEALAADGARVCASPAEAARDAGLLITMVSDGAALEEVLSGRGGALEALPAGSVLLQMATVSCAQVRRAAEQAARRGVRFLDAPVTGGRVGAETAALTIMIGGDAETLERARGVLAAMGKTLVHVGGIGAATLVKLALNVLQAGMVELLAEALALARRAGVRTESFLAVMEASAGASPLLKLKGAMLRSGDTAPQFALKWMDKDLKLAGEEGKAAEATLPVATIVAALYSAAAARGHGEEDYVAVARLIEDLNEIKIAGA